jgi:hypothetical protein
VDGQPLWSLMQMQDLLDEWLIDRFTDLSARIIALTC